MGWWRISLMLYLTVSLNSYKFSSAFRSSVIFYSTLVEVYWQSIFEIIKSDFLSYLVKVLISKKKKKVLISSVGLHFQIHMHSQLFPTFAIWHKPCESSNVMAEERRTKNFYTQLQLLVLNRYTNTMSYGEWKRQLYWTRNRFLKCLESKLTEIKEI